MATPRCLYFTVTTLGAITSFILNINRQYDPHVGDPPEFIPSEWFAPPSSTVYSPPTPTLDFPFPNPDPVANGFIFVLIALVGMLMGCLSALSLLRPARNLALAIVLAATDAIAYAFATVLPLPSPLPPPSSLPLPLPSPLSIWGAATCIGMAYPMAYVAGWFSTGVIQRNLVIHHADTDAIVFVWVQYMLAQFFSGGPGIYSADRSSRATAYIFISGLAILSLDMICSHLPLSMDPSGSPRLVAFACTNIICALLGRETPFAQYLSMFLEGPSPEGIRLQYLPLKSETAWEKSLKQYWGIYHDEYCTKRTSILATVRRERGQILQARMSLGSSRNAFLDSHFQFFSTFILFLMPSDHQRPPPASLPRIPALTGVPQPSSTIHERMERHSRSQRAQLDYIKPWQHPAYQQPQFCPTDRRPAALIDESRKNGAAQPVTARARAA
ncbi:hypothetical protein BKA62DRAFT_802792 [Auriculariales sp. MPI-PUGE-AT-0066]|nr:hypothetical protein BKA62DRAFT_802792 [Auriculariales sp. MPI-PUGE-AT-0066]